MLQTRTATDAFKDYDRATSTFLFITMHREDSTHSFAYICVRIWFEFWLQIQLAPNGLTRPQRRPGFHTAALCAWEG